MATNDDLMAVLQQILARLDKLENIHTENLNIQAVSSVTIAGTSQVAIENLSELLLKADNGSTFANTSIEIQGEVDSINSVCNGPNSNITIHAETIEGEVNCDTLNCSEISGEISS